MDKVFIKIYDCLAGRKTLFWCVLIALTLVMGYFTTTIRYDEQITSFFPNEGNNSLVFENMKMKDRIVVMFSPSDTTDDPDPERLIECGDAFQEAFLSNIDLSYVRSVMSGLGAGQIDDVVAFVYDNLPLFLTDADYARTDSLLAVPGGIAARMEYDYNLIVSPIGAGIRNVLVRDPLGIGGQAMERLQGLAINADYEIFDDHLFLGEMGTMIIMVDPTHGMGDTGSNEKLIDAIECAIAHVAAEGYVDVQIEYMGGPTYAVHNARQIKRDTLLTLLIALTVIITFVLLAFRNRWAVFLIITPVVFGGLFALSLIALFGDGSMSAIAIGAGAAVFGIALSYSIHVISHSNHTRDPRQVIRELTYPLTVGSFTTIGAFVSLMFTQSQLLRDFGLFSALTLVGTTLYCLIFLPHFLNSADNRSSGRFLKMIEKMNDYPYDRNKWLVGGIVVLVVACLFFFNKVRFDSDMMNLNYSPAKLKRAEAKLRGLFGDDSPITFASTGSGQDAAFDVYRDTNRLLDSLQEAGTVRGYSSAEAFLPPPSRQRERIERWNEFWGGGKREDVIAEVNKGASHAGFRAGAFDRFGQLLTKQYEVATAGADTGLPVLDDWFVAGDNFAMYLSQVSIDPDRKEDVYEAFMDNPDVVVVDRGYFANQMAKTVNDDFSLILYFSSFLIFGALLLSYGRIELALMAFLPMFLSWIIILGLMAVFGIEFNIVNIILSTFIFGIGDDFSIFIMDGLLAEYREGKKLLTAHKTAIFFSAFTIIVGIGVLVFAKHPALHSLAAISIFGIIAVVLVAFTIQPIIFRVFISSQTRKGGFPYTLMGLLNTLYAFVYFLLGCFMLQAIILMLVILPVARRKKKLWFHTSVSVCVRILLRTMFTVKRVNINKHGEKFEKPAVVIANHQSFIDILVMLSLHPKMVMVTNSWVWRSPFFGRIVRYCDFYHTADGYEQLAETLRPMVREGYSVMIFPEGTRSPDCRIRRFHKGAFYLAQELGVDIIPVLLYGNGLVSSKPQPLYIKKGLLVSKIMPRVTPDDDTLGADYRDRTKLVEAWFRRQYDLLSDEYGRMNNPYFRDALIKNYIYKGPVLEWYMRVKLRMEHGYRFFDELIPRDASVVDIGCGYGGLAYMLSLLSPRRDITGVDYDQEKIALANHNFSRTDNIRFECHDALDYELPQADVFVLSDVLHYMDYASQDTLLERCFARMNDGGMVVVRDGDSSQRRKQRVTEKSEKWSTKIIGFNKTVGKLWFTSTERIVSLAQKHGMAVRVERNDTRTSNMIYLITRTNTGRDE